MLLALGKIIFFNEAKLAVNYFAGINYRCPELSNPADYFMSIMSIESQEQEDYEDKEQMLKSQTMIMDNYKQRIQEFHENY
jgi:ABC-2 type transporter